MVAGVGDVILEFNDTDEEGVEGGVKVSNAFVV